MTDRDDAAAAASGKQHDTQGGYETDHDSAPG